MVLVDVAHDRPAQSVPARIFRAAAKWLADRHAARRRRKTLDSLMAMPDHRLRDIGICRETLLERMDLNR